MSACAHALARPTMDRHSRRLGDGPDLCQPCAISVTPLAGRAAQAAPAIWRLRRARKHCVETPQTPYRLSWHRRCPAGLSSAAPRWFQAEPGRLRSPVAACPDLFLQPASGHVALKAAALATPGD